jgi:formate dehydrogenase assembly factor FdhD
MVMHNKGCPEEYPITLIVKGYEVAIFQLTNHDLEAWTYGYLFSEGLIDNEEDIGRHNAVDKVNGYAVRNRILLFFLQQGESPMKCFQKPLNSALTVGSRTAATKQAIQLDRIWGKYNLY